MARGWESKHVESQIEAAQSGGAAAQARRITIAEAERNQRRNSLLLSRTRVLRDLEAAQNPRYREILRSALKHLDDKLAEIPKTA